MSYTMITEKGREKLCKAHAGDLALPKIKWIAFGTGGIDAAHQAIPVTGEEVSLRSEQYRTELQHQFPIPTTCEYLSNLGKQVLQNQYISELGFFDEEEDLVMYSTFLPKGKDDDMEWDFNVKEVF